MTKLQVTTDPETRLKYAHISNMDCYKQKSFEELRMEDYKANRLQSGQRGMPGQQAGGMFGANTGGDMFGNTGGGIEDRLRGMETRQAG